VNIAFFVTSFILELGVLILLIFFHEEAGRKRMEECATGMQDEGW
jgi:hypothetical protein